MSLENKLKMCQNRGRKIFAAYMVSSLPDFEKCISAALAIVSSGADILEIGVPFSDPTADGPVIQAAAQKALARGVNLRMTLELIRRIRQQTDAAIVIMAYYNTLLSYGLGQLAADAAAAGVDGFIVPDLPPEESFELKKYTGDKSIDVISMVTPFSGGRTENICKNARGFLYVVSSSGVTGARDKINTDFSALSPGFKKYTGIPALVGFGISGPRQAGECCKYFDGVIIGSAIVRIIDETPDSGLLPELADFISSIRKEIDKELE